MARQAARHLTLLLTGVAVTAAAQEQLDPVTVSAPRLERERLETPAAVTVVGEQPLRRGRQRLSLDEGLSRVPGLFFQNRYNFAQGLRISSRGFGARSPFGIRGLRLRVDGLPLTLPDGQSQVDSVDLASLVRAEVVRGPASVLYGNATGGVIDLTTADGTSMRHSPVFRAQAGDDGYRKVNARVGGSDGPWAHHVSLTGLDYEGFREQSAVRRGRLNAKLTRDLGDGRSLQGIVTVLDAPTGEDPGGLSPAEAEADPSQATDFAKRLDAGQDVDEQRVGVVYEDESGAGTFTARAHYTRRDFQQQLPFPGSSLIGYERDFFGAGLSWQGRLGAGEDAVRYLVGGAWDRQIDDRERFGVAADGEVTGLLEEEEQRATALGVFGQLDVPLGERWTVTLGMRGDRNRFAIDDAFLADGDQSGDRTFEEVNYLAGVSYRLAADHQLYANVASAFETPTFTEFANPGAGGGFNPDVGPQQALNREVGARGTLGNLGYEMAVFSVRVDDELVPFQLVPGGRDFYENAGRTRRNGLELGVEWFVGDAWTVTASYTYADYTFREFRQDGESLRGEQLPGIPRHNAVAELLWEPVADGYAAVEAELVGPVYADNANTERVAGYGLVHLRAGRTWRPRGLGRLEVFGGVRNLFDRQHPANVRINFDDYVEPAPGRTAYVGVELGF